MKRPRIIKRAAPLTLIVTIAALFVALPAAAHGGGTVRTFDTDSGYDLAVETNETPNAGRLGGTIHVTTIVTAKGASSRLRHLNVEVMATSPTKKQVGPVKASLALNGTYEADLSIAEPGVWEVVVHVADKSGNTQTAGFELKVESRSWLTDIGVIGGLMLIPILGLIGMRKAASTHNA